MISQAEHTAAETIFIPSAQPLLPKKICFVCTGNTCRSPMAAAVANELGKDLFIQASSAGLYPTPGAPISDNALEALFRAGIRPSDSNRFDKHAARAVDRAIMGENDMMIAISKGHMLTLVGAFPEYAGKIRCMPKDISDPYGGDLATYRMCLSEITAGIKELLLIDTENS